MVAGRVSSGGREGGRRKALARKATRRGTGGVAVGSAQCRRQGKGDDGAADNAASPQAALRYLSRAIVNAWLGLGVVFCSEVLPSYQYQR
jgi:hypothetical protein